ncbi:MAG: hypothetical protein OXG38_07655 [Chloroflexi bacterium]|nr:hypothetical protein [Chloroflexota bacterium]
MEWLPFQRRFFRRALAPGVRTAALSLPRGNGKTSLIAELARRALTPGDALHHPGTESHIVASSLGQSRRTVWRLLVESLGGEPGYRWAESQNAVHCIHEDTGTKLSVLAANGKAAMGLVRAPLVLLDEPGAWETVGGELMFSAVQTAQGKPGASMRAVYVGTLAPATAGWWHDLATGESGDGVHAVCYQGDRERWENWRVIQRCNPLMAKFPESRRVLLAERDAARHDTAALARFLSYRLNVPSADESEVVLTVRAWQSVCGRPVPEPDGYPVVGVDLGGGRAWSAAAAIWPSGRVEAVAVAPGDVSIAEQERRDRVPSGTYEALIASGRLTVDGTRAVPRVEVLLDQVREWEPGLILCDRFRHSDLIDAGPPCPVEARVTRWSECSEDLRALRAWAVDGELAVEPESRELVGASLAVSRVKTDDQGNTRLVKSRNNHARDDVVAALVLAAGEAERRRRRSVPYEIKVHVAP